MKENLYEPDCIRTISGTYVNIFSPTIEMINIEDISHSLSNQCRFGGHLLKFYSVAQHSVMVSRLVDPEYKLQALMHDSSEAYLLDIPTPIKHKLTNYKKIENNMMYLIAAKYGFTYPLEAAVKYADNVMLEWEWEHIHLQNLVNGNEKPIIWSHEASRKIFMNEFNHLTK